MTSDSAGTAVPARNMPAEDVARKAQSARHAAALWRRYSLSQRVDIIRALWKELSGHRRQISRIIHEETGRPFAEIEMTEISSVEMAVRYATSNAHRILQDQAAWRPWVLFNKRAYTRFVPRGLVGLITPWSLPFMIPLGDALAAMLAGNAVLLKPSEWTTRTALWMEEVVMASGLLPEGLFAVATGDGAVGAEVVAQSDMVLFTGSKENGRLVAQAAAKGLKPVVLELGGKHPMIVFKDASISRAAKAAVWGAFSNCGQLHGGVERVFVEADVYEAFVALVRRETASLRQGLGGEEVDIGRFVFPSQLARVKDHLDDARQKGAHVIGGEILDEAGPLISPALVLNAAPEMKVMRDETFGPVMPIMKVESGEEAIRLCNDGFPGLCASLWTGDLDRADMIGGSVEAGMLGVNDLMNRMSRRHSDEGLRMFCWPQAVSVHEWPANAGEPWWFPYDAFKTRLARLLASISRS